MTPAGSSSDNPARSPGPNTASSATARVRPDKRSARNRRPVLRRFQISARDGESIDGGVISSISARTALTRPSMAQNSGYFAASFGEKGRIASAVRAGSLEKTSARPSEAGATRRGSGLMTGAVGRPSRSKPLVAAGVTPSCWEMATALLTVSAMESDWPPAVFRIKLKLCTPWSWAIKV